MSEINADSLLRSNLQRVFNERDPSRRAVALDELFVDDPVMYEPEAEVRGKDAIGKIAGELLAKFGPTFAFTPEGSAVGHHGLACLRWHAGPAGGPVAVTGIDAAEIADGKIARLWVLLDPPAP